MKEKSKLLNLVIVNVEQLQAGLTAQASFDEEGGNVGSSPSATWHLRSYNGAINLNHFSIIMIDGAFCVHDVCGLTYINSSNMPIGLGNSARLRNEDLLKIGDYEIRVLINKDISDNSINECWDEFENENVSELLTDNFLLTDDIVKKENSLSLDVDPLELIDSYEDTSTPDILLPDESEFKNSLISGNGDEQEVDLVTTVVQADSDEDIASAIILKSSSKAARKIKSKEQLYTVNSKKNEERLLMDEDILDLLEEEAMKNYSSENEAVEKTVKAKSTPKAAPKSRAKTTPKASPKTRGKAISKPTSKASLPVSPILNGLGVVVDTSENKDKVQMLQHEVGATLQSCIQGLLDLQKQVKESRYGLMNKNLQPIEDNPLRLGLSYEETVRVLFDEKKSLVHLSGPSAVEESLKTLLIHNDAVQYATNIALEKILDALSPEVLLKRFSRYRRDKPEEDESNSWAWDMYESYYEELTSNRQQGFEKLFWEIFDQSYDQKVRDEHSEY